MLLGASEEQSSSKPIPCVNSLEKRNNFMYSNFYLIFFLGENCSCQYDVWVVLWFSKGGSKSLFKWKGTAVNRMNKLEGLLQKVRFGFTLWCAWFTETSCIFFVYTVYCIQGMYEYKDTILSEPYQILLISTVDAVLLCRFTGRSTDFDCVI